MESVTSKPSSVMPGIGAAVSVIVHSTAPTMAEAAGAKPLTPRQTRVTQHKVCSVLPVWYLSRRITTNRTDFDLQSHLNSGSNCQLLNLPGSSCRNSLTKAVLVRGQTTKVPFAVAKSPDLFVAWRQCLWWCYAYLATIFYLDTVTVWHGMWPGPCSATVLHDKMTVLRSTIHMSMIGRNRAQKSTCEVIIWVHVMNILRLIWLPKAKKPPYHVAVKEPRETMKDAPLAKSFG